MKIYILVDDPESWIIEWARKIKQSLSKGGHYISLVHHQSEIEVCDIAFYLGCTKIVSRQVLDKSKSSIVVHPSNLPKGRGFSPLAWQVLEGNHEITVCLFEATEGVDEGGIYLKSSFNLSGLELNDEIKQKQGQAILDLCLEYVKKYGHIKTEAQLGEPTYYDRRSKGNSELDVHKTISEQFNLLRVVDNERYPAFFYFKNKKYILKIYDDK
ncbi:MAG: methionyl-tRNA formyltransferase [Candidatus Marinimicrobia bacterium]|jgi:methionyl-tRNA formyltransferase|nr:methionyl-tRNA formyltransferase [Candidatus Neomarinimicrobiota bacterium]